MSLSAQQQQDINILLNEQYINLHQANTHKSKHNILYNIIDTKISLKLNNKLYLDIKLFIKHYVSASEEQDAGYDVISTKKVTDIITTLKQEEQISLLKHFSFYLSKFNYESDKGTIEDQIHNLKISVSQSKLKESISTNFIEYIYLITTKSKINIAISVTSILSIQYLVLLPSPFDWMTTINYEHPIYLKHLYTDSFLNMMSLIFSVDDKTKVTPLNALGLLQILIAKIIFIVVVTNILIKGFTNKINL